ncbi:hypothetical protein [Solimonas terrae]|uniref:DUF4405 domain-containing protein n=1 Tax=Solimonas terrae TaxID=1396819 RepID=A0A6M2BQP7_9GAMM|nr:hypothetical protein [Solimonas terrae]NGY04393.1 hypothetical protein [Solimonas terrae]
MNRNAAHHGLPARLPKAYELWVYLLAGGVTASGMLWLVFEHFVRVTAEFGPEHHWLQHWWLVVHGVLAMAAVWGFGVLWPIHIRRAWHQRRHRYSGGSVFGCVAFLLLSGLLLYYGGGDRLRDWTATAHWLIGLGAATALALHIVIALRQRRARSPDAP